MEVLVSPMVAVPRMVETEMKAGTRPLKGMTGVQEETLVVGAAMVAVEAALVVPVVLLRPTTAVTPVLVPLAWALRPQTTPMRVAVAAVVRRLVVLLRRLRVQMSVASQPHRLGSHRVPHQTLVQVVAVGSGFQVLIAPVALVEEGSLFLDTLIPVHSDG